MIEPVKLSVIVDGLDPIGEETSAHLDTKTGEVVFVTAEDRQAIEDGNNDVPEWQKDALATARAVVEDTEGRFLDLPSRFDIHEYSIMEDFCRSLEDEEASEELCYAIQGRGAFRRFKDAIRRLGVADRWYEFRDAAFKQIAIDWCEAHEIPYCDDVVQKPKHESP